jgi:hypothetical protein
MGDSGEGDDERVRILGASADRHLGGSEIGDVARDEVRPRQRPCDRRWHRRDGLPGPDRGEVVVESGDRTAVAARPARCSGNVQKSRATGASRASAGLRPQPAGLAGPSGWAARTSNHAAVRAAKVAAAPSATVHSVLEAAAASSHGAANPTYVSA